MNLRTMFSAPKPGEVPTETIASWSSYKRLGRYIRPYWKALVVVLVISALSTLLGLAQPYLSKLLIDDALMQRDMDALWLISGVMIVLALLGFAVNILASYRYVSLSARMLFDIRSELLRHLQTLSPRFYSTFRLGDLVSRINSDVSDVQRVAADTMLSVISNVLFFIGCVAMMLWLDWKLFCVSILLVPASLMAFVWCQRRLTQLTAIMRQNGANLGSLLVDSIMGMRVITTLRAGEHEIGRFKQANDRFVHSMLRMQAASYLAGGLPGTIMTAATAAVVLYGGARIIDGQMTIGTLVAFMAYHGRLLSPVQTLMGLGASLASARVSLGRIFALFDTKADVTEKTDAKRLNVKNGLIEFDGVTMRYDRDTVLDNVSFAVDPGSITAIIGESGAGKSTMADLMVRMHDPLTGVIRVDGQDLRDVVLDDLRQGVILVDQTPYLFHASIADNIAFAWPEATPKDIEQAGHAAGLDRLIEKLPQGYATITGERGLALSAGERQRIVMARAILRKPKVIILDEPTSALDAETEQMIASRLRTALPDTTIVIITHKPALAAIADSVLTVAKGRVTVELGTKAGAEAQKLHYV